MPSDAETFREDYEIYGAEIGILTISYEGDCTIEYCPSHLLFTTTRDIPITPTKIENYGPPTWIAPCGVSYSRNSGIGVCIYCNWPKIVHSDYSF